MSTEGEGAENTVVFTGAAVELKLIDEAAASRVLERCRREPTQPVERALAEEGLTDPRLMDTVRELAESRLEAHDDDPFRTIASFSMSPGLRRDTQKLLEEGRGAAASSDGDEGTGTVVGFSPRPATSPRPAAPASPFGPTPSSSGMPSDFEVLAESQRAGVADTINPVRVGPAGRSPDWDAMQTDGGSNPDFSANAWKSSVVGPSVAGTGDVGTRTNSTDRFRVLRPHARGGLGAVSVAYDEELRREVALKEIREAHAEDLTSRTRFLLEAEVTGGLEHPGVVPVYSLGRNEQGRPYYAMRFIRGESLRKAIDRLHAEKAKQKPGEYEFSLRQLLKRFVDVCNALEYAHSRRVIHRDIKPDNIMLGPYGETLVVDWGLAKPLDKPGDDAMMSAEGPLRPLSTMGSTPTLAGSVIGTPAFMAPEQAEGDPAKMGPGCDIYSMGATLYMMLTGKVAFTDKDAYKVLVKVIDGEFPRPRELDKNVPPALEAITLKAMARREADRYPSCKALADDVERWLADEPVSVYEDPWTVRFSRWAKRHKTLVATTAVMLPTVVVGLSVFSALIGREQAKTYAEWKRAEANEITAKKNEAEAVKQRGFAEANATAAQKSEAEAVKQRGVAEQNATIARKKEEEAVEQRGIAQRYAERAEQNFGTAMGALDSLLTEVGDIDLRDVPQMEATRRNLLEKALAFYSEFLQKNDRDVVKREVARAFARVGEIRELLGELGPADGSFADAEKLQRELLANAPDSDQAKRDLAKTLHPWGVALKKLNRFPDAEAKLRDAIALRQGLSEEKPEDDELRKDLAESRYQLGALLAKLNGRTDEAKALYREAIEAERGLVQRHPDDPEQLSLLARYLNNLAQVSRSRDDEETTKLYDEALGLERRLVEMNSETPSHRADLAWFLNNRGALMLRTDFARAETLLKEAVTLAEGLTEDYPLVPDYWKDLAGYQSNLGQAYKERGRQSDSAEPIKEAQESLAKAIEIRRELVRDYPDRPEYRQRLAMNLNNLAAMERGLGQSEEALKAAKEGEGLLESLAEKYADVPEYRRDLAKVLLEGAYDRADLADLPGAKEAAERSLSEALKAKSARPEDSDYAETPLRATQGLAQIAIRADDLEVASARVGEFEKLAEGRAQDLFVAAVMYTQCYGLATRGAGTDAEKQAAAEGFREASLRAFGAAIDAGYENVEDAERLFGGSKGDPKVVELMERMREAKKEQ